MNTVEIIESLIEKSNKSASKILKELLISHNAIGEWKKGKANPSANALYKIAEYFDVSLDYLFGRTETDCFEMSMIYDSLTPQMREEIIAYSEKIFFADKKSKKEELKEEFKEEL